MTQMLLLLTEVKVVVVMIVFIMIKPVIPKYKRQR